MKALLVRVLQGMFMGVAQMIPGVSGATVALMMGIYQEFLEVLYGVSQVVKSIGLVLIFREKPQAVIQEIQTISWRFAVPVFGGMVGAIIGLASIFDWALSTYPQYVYGFFFGLVLMSVKIPWQTITYPRIKHALIIWGTAIIFSGLLLVANPPTLTEVPLWYLFLGGLIGISGMILPGISGSFILLLMGLYEYVVGLVRTVSTADMSVILPIILFSLGMLIGFISFVRILKWIMKSYTDSLMAFLSGILFASLPVLWPFFQVRDGQPVIVPVGSFARGEIVGIVMCIVLGISVVVVLQKISQKRIDI